MRHANFIGIREGKQEADFRIIFVDGIYFRADVTAGFFGGKQEFIEIIIVHNLPSGLYQSRHAILLNRSKYEDDICKDYF